MHRLNRLVSALLLVFTAATWLGTVNAESRPNILFCIADDASYPHMSAYGCQWVSTPGFDRVAREGLLFTRAYTPNAKCAPSRACILTGRNSWQLKEAANHWCHFPPQFKTYAEALSDNGYFVGKTAKGWAPGIAVDANGKKRLMTGKSFDKRRMKPPASKISPNDYASNFQDFLNANAEDQPWCFWYGSTEPHRAYEYAAGINKGDKSIDDIDDVPGFWPDNETVRTDMLDYAFEIEHFDRHLDRMLKLLDERNELDNTLVVVTADNGMPFPRIKGQAYELSNHLPLAIMWPKGVTAPGRTVDDYVSFIDFAPTFLQAAGLDAASVGMQPITGRSLFATFHNQTGPANPHRDHILIGKERHDIGRPEDAGYPIRGIVKENLLYVKNFETTRWPAGNPETGYLNTDGSPTKTVILQKRRLGDIRYWDLAFGKRVTEELYDLDSDPTCLNNLATDPDHLEAKQILRKQLVEELTEEGDPRMAGNGEMFDKYPYASDSGRGFYERYMSGEKLSAGWVNTTDFEPDLAE